MALVTNIRYEFDLMQSKQPIMPLLQTKQFEITDLHLQQEREDDWGRFRLLPYYHYYSIIFYFIIIIVLYVYYIIVIIFTTGVGG